MIQSPQSFHSNLSAFYARVNGLPRDDLRYILVIAAWAGLGSNGEFAAMEM
ncbi:MAG: hypothetical protein Q8M31_03345 [Beijerinckiaceae bacterium]|nr:hypothetical protein [Beijerinckiaceae bacterium]